MNRLKKSLWALSSVRGMKGGKNEFIVSFEQEEKKENFTLYFGRLKDDKKIMGAR
jgi:hypothetical protein